ncbi:MAG TPA: hypothetical protein VIL42_02235 [Sphingomicrobium sp.]|jgi:hypothetical protein
MYLPLRLAASLPIGIVFLGAVVVGLATAQGRQLHPVYGYPNAMLIAFLAAIPALLLVLPNIAGALAANHFANSSVLAFIAIFVAVFALGCFLEVQVLNSIFRGNLVDANSRGVWAAAAANILVMLAVAAWHGRGTHA